MQYTEGARKFGLFWKTIFLTIIFAGLFGILHDQLTFTVSEEYFTKFKFRQFNFGIVDEDDERMMVAMVGFYATWWVGAIIGLVLAAVGYIYTTYENMRTAINTALVIVFAITVFFSFAGYFWGRFYLVNKGVDWWLPEDLLDRDNFIIVGSIHNFSYIGGAVGLLLAIVYMFRNKNILVRQRK
jgi:hypothetical protein